MPVYNYSCTDCGVATKRLRPAAEGNLPFACDCGGQFERNPSAVPSIRVVEVLDNGIMTKAVERPADAERLFRERARQPKEKP